jgi:Do/DeqQ family serine protease
MKRTLGILMAAVLGSLITLSLSSYFFGDKTSVVRVEHADSAPVSSARYGDSPLLDFTLAAERSMPAVVHIKSTSLNMGRQPSSGIPDIFRDFFGAPSQPQGQPRPQVGSGSGVILTKDGYIVTNNHVIDRADDIEVILNNNQTFKAKVVGTDPSTDLALLQIDADDLTAITVANSDDVRVGQWVLAVGNPFSLNSTATAGIVSAKARNINILRDQSAIESFIQTDAAVNPGNSGGALVNLDGELVGINTAIASPTGAYSGYAFAVPSNLMRKVIKDLMDFGTVQRGYLGVMIRDVDGNFAREENLNVTEGVYVTDMMENSAAEDAGLERGDIIVAVDGNSVKTSSQLQAAVGTRRPGDAVNLTINRRGDRKNVNITLKNRSGSTDVVAREEVGALDAMGVELKTLEATEAKRLGLSGGVQITRLLRGKLSQQTDIREGFIITKVNDQPVKDIEDVKKLINNRRGGVMLEGTYADYPGTYYYAFGM